MSIRMNRLKVDSPTTAAVSCSQNLVLYFELVTDGLTWVIEERYIRSRYRQIAFHFHCFEIICDFKWERFEKLQQ